MENEIKKEQTDGKHRVIYHCHPANLIALTFVLPLSDEVFYFTAGNVYHNLQLLSSKNLEKKCKAINANIIFFKI